MKNIAPAETHVQNEKKDNIVSYIFLFFVIISLCGAFNVFFYGKDGATDGDSSQLYQWAKRATALVPLIVMLTSWGRFKIVLFRMRIILFFIAYCLIGLALSPQKEWAINWISFFSISVLMAACVGTLYGPKNVLRFFTFFMIASLLFNMAFIALLPQAGIVQAGEAHVQGSIPGDWRGIYSVKNAMGHVVGIYTGALAAFGRDYFRNRSILYLAILVGLVSTVMSRSGTGIVLMIFVFATYQSLKKGAGARFYAFMIALTIGATAFMAFPSLFGAVLNAAFGKDATLSGRTVIWQYAANFIWQHPLIGYGPGYTSSLPYVTAMRLQFDVPHFHNAFLDCLANGGIVGFALFYGFHIFAAARTLRLRDLSIEETKSRAGFIALLAGWFFSGITEIDAAREAGPLPMLALIVTTGLVTLRLRGVAPNALAFRSSRTDQRPSFGRRPPQSA
jgi:O-antigen ligase